MINKEVDRFFKLFTGHSSYMADKYIALKKEDSIKEKDSKTNETESFSITKIIYFLFFPLLFLIFLVFTLVSIIMLRPQKDSYYQTINAVNLLKGNANSLFDSPKKTFITLDEYANLSKQFFLPFIKYGNIGNKAKLFETIYQVTSLRIGFVRRNKYYLF